MTTNTYTYVQRYADGSTLDFSYTAGRTRSGNEIHVILRGRPVCRSGNWRTGAYPVNAAITCDKCLTRYGMISEKLNGGGGDADQGV